MENITVKFGGSSLADAKQFRKVADIIHADPRRRFVVVSAPGRRHSGDTKVTDLLYKANDCAGSDEFSAVMAEIQTRFEDIARGLALDVDLGLEEIADQMQKGAGPDYCASRGEYLNGKLMASFLNRPFLDARDYIFFRADGSFDDQRTEEALGQVLADYPDGAVIPGFYGSLPDGRVHTFSRGGSDITGSLVARAAKSICYENWTDVSGFLITDPRIVPQAKPISQVTYRELRELAYMGASVLHEDSIFPVRTAGIPIRIRNTNAPQDEGTLILKDASQCAAAAVTGIAGKKDFSIIQIEKDRMNEAAGFVHQVVEPFCRRGVSIEHMPTGIDSISVVVPSAQLRDCRSELLCDIRDAVNPDVILVETDLAMIAVVGRGMVRRKGIAAKVFTALAQADINIRMIDQGSGELNIIVGVDNVDYEKAIQALYAAFFSLS